MNEQELSEKFVEYSKYIISDQEEQFSDDVLRSFDPELLCSYFVFEKFDFDEMRPFSLLRLLSERSWGRKVIRRIVAINISLITPDGLSRFYRIAGGLVNPFVNLLRFGDAIDVARRLLYLVPLEHLYPIISWKSDKRYSTWTLIALFMPNMLMHMLADNPMCITIEEFVRPVDAVHYDQKLLSLVYPLKGGPDVFNRLVLCNRHNKGQWWDELRLREPDFALYINELLHLQDHGDPMLCSQAVI